MLEPVRAFNPYPWIISPLVPLVNPFMHLLRL